MKRQYDLKNKTVVITGGAGLIGSAFSKACSEHIANVVIVDIDAKKGHNLVKELKKETGNESIIFKTIDVLVNNAYPRNKNYGRKFEDVTYEDFCENVNMHLGGYFLTTKEISKVMIKQNNGNIINMASIYGFSAPRFEIYKETDMTMPIEYAAIKGAIVNLTRYLASYLGKYNIRVNTLSPGGVFNNQPESFIKKYSEKVVSEKRMENTDDLIGTLIFLVSDASKRMTGQNIVVDGGWTL